MEIPVNLQTVHRWDFVWRETAPGSFAWIAIDYAVMGRVTIQQDGSYWWDCCANGGWRKQSGKGHARTLGHAKLIVETIIGNGETEA